MSRTFPKTASKASGQLVTGALWNAGPLALSQFMFTPPLFRGHQSANQSVPSGTWVAMNLDVSDGDSDSGHSITVNNSRYTCQVAGWYYVQGYFSTLTGSNIGRYESAIAKNGTIVPGSSEFSLALTNDLFSILAGTLVQLAVGDYVETWGRQNTGGTLTTYAGSDLDPCMNVFWIHT